MSPDGGGDLMAEKNTYRKDENLEEPFDIRHLLSASSYIKKYLKGMLLAFLFSAIGGATALFGPICALSLSGFMS